MSEITANPLMKHFRQPKLFIDLPSKGLFYAPGSLEKTENNKNNLIKKLIYLF